MQTDQLSSPITTTCSICWTWFCCFRLIFPQLHLREEGWSWCMSRGPLTISLTSLKFDTIPTTPLVRLFDCSLVEFAKYECWTHIKRLFHNLQSRKVRKSIFSFHVLGFLLILLEHYALYRAESLVIFSQDSKLAHFYYEGVYFVRGLIHEDYYWSYEWILKVSKTQILFKVPTWFSDKEDNNKTRINMVDYKIITPFLQNCK